MRGRPIRLLAAELSTSTVCGMWIASDTADYLVYDPTTSLVHQEHIILHELGHLLFRHRGSFTVDRAASSMVTPTHRAAAGARYASIDEVEAEIMASLLRGRADRPPPDMPGADNPLQRLTDALLHGR